MNIKSNKDILIKKNLKLILDAMMPGDDFMPSFTKAVRVQTIIKKLKKSKFLYDLKKKEFDFNKKQNWEKCTNILGNDMIDAYFTSNLVIKSLNLRRKIYLKNVKKENMVKMLKKVKNLKKRFRK